MIPKIFDIEKGKLIINHNCLSIPELKAINDKYENPIPAFNFLYFMYAHDSPYANIVQAEKESVLLLDYPGDYTLEDSEMIAAMRKIELLTVTTTYRYYLDSKILLEKLGKFAREAPITAGRDGNINALSSQIKSVGKTILEFKQLEKVVLQELDEAKTRTRGDKKLAYDQL